MSRGVRRDNIEVRAKRVIHDCPPTGCLPITVRTGRARPYKRVPDMRSGFRDATCPATHLEWQLYEVIPSSSNKCSRFGRQKPTNAPLVRICPVERNRHLTQNPLADRPEEDDGAQGGPEADAQLRF